MAFSAGYMKRCFPKIVYHIHIGSKFAYQSLYNFYMACLASQVKRSHATRIALSAEIYKVYSIELLDARYFFDAYKIARPTSIK